MCWHPFSSTQLQVPCAICLLSGSLLLPGLHKGVRGSPELSASPYLPPSWGSEPEPRRPPRHPTSISLLSPKPCKGRVGRPTSSEKSTGQGSDSGFFPLLQGP